MRYKFLGNTGLLVSELCFGAMTFGGKGFYEVIGSQNDGEADRLIGRSLEAGINFIDTANTYAEGESERILGRVLGTRRRDLVLATKVFGRQGPGPNQAGLSRGHIMQAVDDSLQRLQTDYIDLYQIHNFDFATPLEETLRALDDLVRAGKVRYIGASNLAAWQLMKALGISDKLGLTRFDSLQAYYTIAGRDLEREIVPLLNDQKVGLMIWSPLAGGFLSGKYTRENEKVAGARRASFDFPPVDRERGYNIIDELQKVAATHNASVAQVALAWLLHQPVVTSVIVGAKTLEQLDDNLGAPDVKLSEDELTSLNQVSQLPAEYPGWIFERTYPSRLPGGRSIINQFAQEQANNG